MAVTACIDESGKFKDHKVISLGCVGGYSERFNKDFSSEWASLLRLNGLREFSGKHVLRHKYPLSSKNPCLGVDARCAAILPFIRCIRNHLQMICGVAFDAEAYKSLPQKFLQMFGDDPALMAYMRLIMCVAEFTPSWDKAVMVCDDEESTALHFYHLYRRLRKIWPPAKKCLVGISFVDDHYYFGVQASDLVASLLRHEAASKMKGTSYEYNQLYDALVADPEKHENYLFAIGVLIGTRDNLINLATETLQQREKELRDYEEQIGKVREFRPNDARLDQGASRRGKSKTGGGKGRKNKKKGEVK